MPTAAFSVPGKVPGKPRMTQADKWKKRPACVRYWLWKDLVNAEIKRQIGSLPPASSVLSLSWVAHFLVPKSWSKAKRQESVGQLHRSRPDRDNIDKALLDAMFSEDSGIAAGSVKKVWGEKDCLEVTIIF